jgi:hypothetical protein
MQRYISGWLSGGILFVGVGVLIVAVAVWSDFTLLFFPLWFLILFIDGVCRIFGIPTNENILFRGSGFMGPEPSVFGTVALGVFAFLVLFIMGAMVGNNWEKAKKRIVVGS